MAKLKFGALVTSGSGSLGGHTIQNSKGGPQLRTKPIARNMPSDSQRAIRSINPILQTGWKNLTDSQRQIWNNYAKHPLCGHDLWMKYQYTRVVEELPFLSDPSKHLSTYLGPELILNGSFSAGGSFWSKTGACLVSYASFNANLYSYGWGSICQNVLTIGKQYKIKFYCKGSVGMGVAYTAGGRQYWYSIVPDGNNFILYITALATAIHFSKYQTIDYSIFFDDISIKEIFNY